MLKKSKHLEFDSPWKDMIELYFEAFLHFFVPHLHTAIDWSRGYEFLDKELQKVVREAVTQSRRVDKLVQVWLSNQEEILLYDRYGAQVMSLAILGDKKSAWRPQSYHYDQFGCRLTFQFPIIKLLDYQKQWAQLEQGRNPFSHVVRVHLKGLETQKYPQRRLEWKIQLYQSLTEARYTQPEILELLRFLDWVLVLPEDLTLAFDQFVHHYEEAKQMRYVTSFERRGIQQGLEQGLQQGLEQGALQQAQEAVVKVLQVRFTQLPKRLIKQLQQVKDRDQLSQLLEQAVLVNSLQEFKSQFNSK